MSNLARPPSLLHQSLGPNNSGASTSARTCFTWSDRLADRRVPVSAVDGSDTRRRPPADQLSVGLDTRRSGEPHLRCFAGGPGADRPTSGRSDRPARAARPVRSGAGPPRRPSCSRRSGRAWRSARSARSGPSPRPSARIPTATISDQTATSVADRARARAPARGGRSVRSGESMPPRPTRPARGPRPPAPIAGTASASRDAPMPREGGAVNHPRIEL